MKKNTLIILTVLSVMCFNASAKRIGHFDDGRERATIDSVTDTSCLASAVLDGTFTGTGLSNRCDFSATVTASALSGYSIIDYYWEFPTGNFYSTSSMQNFSVANNTSSPFSVEIYATNNVTHDTCEIITLTRSTTCLSGHGSVHRLANGDLSTATTITKSSGFAVYPNPAKDVITLSAENEEIQNVKIINFQGQIVKEVDYPREQTITMQIDNLAAGNYLIRINNSYYKMITKSGK